MRFSLDNPGLLLLVLSCCLLFGTILSTVPTNIRRPGAFHEFIHTAAGRGLTPLTIRVAIIGIKTAAGSAVNGTPIQIFDEVDAETKLGVGSQACMGAKMAFRQARRQGAMPEAWAVTIAEPGASVAAAQTLTVTGTATAAGDVVVRIAGRTIRAGVSVGDVQNTIAAAIKAAIDAIASDLPTTAGVAANVVTCTHRTTGVNGNDVLYEVVSTPAGVAVASAQSVAGTGTVAIATSLDALLDKDYDFICIGNHLAGDVTALITHTTAAWGFAEKKFRFGVLAERGTVSTANTLATGGNDKTVLVITYEGCPNLPIEIAVAAATAAAGKVNPNANLDGEVLELYPPAANLAYTASEIESALAAGATPLAPTFEGTGTQVVRMVTTKTTEGGAPFEALRDLAFPRTAAFLARQVDIGYRTRFKQEVLDGGGDLLQRIRDMVIEVNRAAEAQRIVRDVDTFLPQILVEESPSIAGRVLVQNTFKVAGPLHQAAFVHTHYL